MITLWGEKVPATHKFEMATESGESRMLVCPLKTSVRKTSALTGHRKRQ
jgi:hypothetical protein